MEEKKSYLTPEDARELVYLVNLLAIASRECGIKYYADKKESIEQIVSYFKANDEFMAKINSLTNQ